MWCARWWAEAVMHRLSVALLALCGAGVAWANDITLAPSQALQCMTPPPATRAALAYPPSALERKDGGTVQAEMTFEDATSSPTVKILNQPHEVLAQAVTEHLKRFRVPCLAAGQRLVIRQDFRFDPTDGRRVQWSNARDLGDGARREQLNCLKMPGERPAYPAEALMRDYQGTVVLGLKFIAPDAPPTITVLDDTPDRSLIQAASRFAAQYRLPCLSGSPMEMRSHFQFSINGERLVLRDMPLIAYLKATSGIEAAQVYFDFNEMKCPFDVRVRMRQPVADNQVGEVGESVPERAFFLDWLSRQRLKLNAHDANRLIGDQATIAVPCGTLNLGRRSGGAASQ